MLSADGLEAWFKGFFGFRGLGFRVRIEKCTKFRGLGFRRFRGFGGFGFTVEGLRLSVCDLGVKSLEGLGSFDFSRALRF